MRLTHVLLTVLLGLLSLHCFATDDENLYFHNIQDHEYRSSLTPSEIYFRTQSVLNYYNSPVLSKGQEELSKYNKIQSYEGIKSILKYFDMHGTFDKLFSLSTSKLKGFEDLNGKTKLNFKVDLKNNSHVSDAAFSKKSLKGLKIAIDPGHMGGKNWDQITGKFVRDNNGNYLSEGVIALQTSLLLKNELETLGAKVQLTRIAMGPVTEMKYEDLPVDQFAKRELLEHVYSSWFLKLLSVGTGSTLHRAFDSSPERIKLFDPASRYNYFILKEDLWARAAKIKAFAPDIVLIIHYDVLPNETGHGLNSKAPNQTKVYVSGAYWDIEFGSRLAKTQFARKLLDQKQWNESLNLSTSIVNAFKSEMNLEFPESSQGSIPVAPGVFSRNLTLPRFLTAPAVAYLECLFYNRPNEFYAFLDTKYPMTINGVNYPYSDRLLEVVESIKSGVINYIDGR